MLDAKLDPFFLNQKSSLVTYLLARKAQVGSSKNRKIALILGPGGMRGAFGAGVVAALDSLGLQNVFDIVIGISVGAMQGSYLLAQQANLLPELFYHDLADKRFIHLLRIHSVFGMKYFDEVLTKIKPFDQEIIKKGSTQFYIGTTNAETAQGKFIHINSDKVDILTAIHASAHIPFLQPSPVIINNKRYVDGFIGCDSPISFAVEKGCTDILLVANSQIEGAEQKSFFDKLILNLPMYSPALKRAIKSKKRYGQEIYEDIQRCFPKINIGIIAPETIKLSPLETSKEKLKPITEDAYKRTIEIFS